MRAKHLSTWQALFWLVSFFVLVFAPGGSCGDEESIPKRHSVVECRSQHRTLPVALSFAPETIAPGTIPVAFSAGDDGQPRISISLSALPARGVGPDLAITGFHDGADGILGVGFSLSAMSAITRCPRNQPTDAKIEGVHYSPCVWMENALLLRRKREKRLHSAC